MRRMNIEFVAQPFPDSAQIGALVRSALEDEANSSAWFVSAWGKRSGLSRLAKQLEQFRARGGKAEVILGVDEGGATIEGLELASRLFDEAWIFHDPGARTFHPKMYCLQGEKSATALIGSGNMTRGGLFTNYEIAVGATLDLTDAGDATFLGEARSYFDQLIATEVCKPLSDALIDELRSDPRVLIQSEQQANKRRAKRRSQGTAATSVFGAKALTGLLGAPSSDIEPLSDEESDDDDLLDARAQTQEPATDADAAPTTPVAVWSKTMSRADAQRPTAEGTNPTGVLRLAKAGHSIDHRTWFRQELFAPAEWTPATDRHNNPIEIAVIPMDVHMAGEPLGAVDIRVDHAPHREAGQNNVPTILHWGDVLGEALRENDYTGQDIRLERRSDGSYGLQIG
jgi:hypothetical protein